MAKKAKKGSGQSPVGSGDRPKPGQEVSPRILGEKSGYTERQVQKWCRMGLPCRKVPNGKRTDTLIDLALGLAWIKANATGIPGAHGGKRGGAGRRPRRKDAKAQPPADQKTAAASTIGAVIEPAKPPRRLVPPRPIEAASFAPGAAKDQEDPPAKLWEEMTQPEKLAYLQTKTAVEVKQFLDSQKILTEELARQEKERTLISVEEAKEIWTDICSTAANQLDAKRELIASRLLTELGLPSNVKARIKTIVEQEHAEFITTLRGCAYAGGEA